MAESSTGRASVVVMGGGYGGINAAKALDDMADVTLVDPTEAFVHNVAAWRALVEPEWLDRIFLPYEHLLAHGRFVRDRAVAVDGRRVTLASGDVLEPDYLVLATGSSYPFPAKTEEPDIASARSRFRAAHEALLAADRALIVGAGPAGLELAGEIKAFYPDKQVTSPTSPRTSSPVRTTRRSATSSAASSTRSASSCASARAGRPAQRAAGDARPDPGRAPRTATSSSPTSGSGRSACGRTASTSQADRWATAATSAATSASTSTCASSARPASSPSATSRMPTATWRASRPRRPAWSPPTSAPHHGRGRAHDLGDVPAADRDPARTRGRSGLHRRRRRRRRHDLRAQGPGHARGQLRLALRRGSAVAA